MENRNEAQEDKNREANKDIMEDSKEPGNKQNEQADKEDINPENGAAMGKDLKEKPSDKDESGENVQKGKPKEGESPEKDLEENTGEDEEKSDEKENFPKEKASFFKKKKDKKDEKIEELNDRLMRNMAEFENFRKRSEKEKSQMFEIGAKSIIEKILPVVDNFERGLASISEEEKQGGFAQGIEQIYKQLMNTLKEAGVTPIEAEGKEFNPDFHNAVMHGEDENLGENIVAQELLKGYMYKDSVVRHSMVKVVN